jgi:hypothetical protein
LPPAPNRGRVKKKLIAGLRGDFDSFFMRSP